MQIEQSVVLAKQRPRRFPFLCTASLPLPNSDVGAVAHRADSNSLPPRLNLETISVSIQIKFQTPVLRK